MWFKSIYSGLFPEEDILIHYHTHYSKYKFSLLELSTKKCISRLDFSKYTFLQGFQHQAISKEGISGPFLTKKKERKGL